MVADPRARRPWRRRTCSSARPRTASSGAARRPAAASARGHVAARAAQQQRPARADRPRTTESSVRVWIGRSWSEERVGDAAPAARARRRRGRRSARRRRCRWSSPACAPASASSRWCSGVYGSITPSSRDARRDRRGDAARRRAAARARSAARASPAARSSSGVSSTSARAASSSAAISANGFSSRCLRARSAATAASSSARHARWYPPSPLTATIAPSRSAARRRGGADRSRARSRAQQPSRAARTSGQAFGWAWKRRSSGSSYSAPARRAHGEAGHRRAAAGRRGRRARS